LKTPSFWSEPAEALIERLSTSRDGLSSDVARVRFTEHGPNRVEDETHDAGLRLWLRQLESPLVLILVFGALVSLALRDWLDALLILAIVLGSTQLGFYQEYRASRAVTALKHRLALRARVMRDGSETDVPVDAIVPGDVVRLAAGDLVPADAAILEATDFLVVESSLTGESFPVEKRAGVVPADSTLPERTNAVFLGSSVRSGTARVLVVATGRDTAYGAVAARLAAREPDTEFERGVRRFGAMLVRIMFVIVLFVLTVNQLLDRPAIDSLLFAVALAVGISPELLPAIVSVTLSAGARALAREGVIVRRLEAIENLGSIDVLCTDKTGTLTAGVIVLDDAVDVAGRSSSRVRELAFLNAAFETGIENPLDAAIVAMGEREGLTTANLTKIDEIPYDFRRRRLTIVFAESVPATEHVIVVKGAFDNVLDICASVEVGDAEVPLDDDRRRTLEAYYRSRGEAGYRVLALATRRVAARTDYDHEDERDLAFAGFLLFMDPPKKDAREALAHLAALGIQVKIVTGDNRYVTAHLAETLGLDARAMLTGTELARMKDEALWNVAARTDYFVEIDPQQKERIVRALQRTGHAVGFLGDGINDAPALHAADVGISVDSAVDVARESADVVLLRGDLTVLRQGVEGGRRTFANTLKYISITTSANFGNMISMALVTPWLPFLPLLAKQILLNNFLSDIPSITISTDNVDAEHIVRPQRWNVRDIRRYMIVFGLVSSCFDALTFAALLLVFRASEPEFQTTWFVVSLLTEAVIVLVLRTRARAWHSRPSPLLLWSTVAIGAIAVALPASGPIAALFGFVPLPAHLMVAALAIVAAYVLATELAKGWFYRRV